MYAKCGSMSDAQSVFAAMREDSVVAWTALMLGFVENGHGDLALELFDRMLRSSCRPNARTFLAALKACVSLAIARALPGGENFQGTENHLARRTVLDPERTIEGTIHLDIGETVQAGDFSPRTVLDSSHLRKSTGELHHHLERAVKIHSLARSSGCDSDVFVANTLVDLYAKCGSLDRAQRVFHSIARPTVVSWTSLILGYVDVGDGATALELFERMKIQNTCQADAHCLVAALKACSLAAEKEERATDSTKLLGLEKTRSIHSDALARGYASNIFISSSLIDAYAKCGSMIEARAVFDSMPRHDVICWTSLLTGYAENDEPELCLQLFSCMRSHGCSPDARTFVAALTACSSLADLETGKRIQQELSSHGFQNDCFVANSLIDFYGKCGCLAQAEKVFHAMGSSRRSLVSWSSLIAGYSRQGDAQRVFDLFQAMKDAGVGVNGITFLSVLTACSHTGLVEHGRRYFEEMVTRHAIAPEIEHYHCMVDLLGRANHLDEALEMVTTVMPFKPTVVTWKTVLGACRKWKNAKLGRVAFENLVKLDPKQDSTYLLMSNLYGSLGMWDEQTSVLHLRSAAQTSKKPGLSWWTDDRGLVHAFKVGDKSHPQIEAINSKLRTLALQLKENGHVADLSSVFHNISDVDKEDALCEHSERLAIACALVNTAPGTAIRVVKSLRFCDDCHSVIAGVSKLEQRQIVCRDSSRFHVFENGRCSCNNFW
ncbi:pentatricopeptide repeat-containing protein At3g26782, mitochondrial-like [Selaginella moellendorffii]|uniref:pentatricopeptide repeat-containing protein At3g26782, mitochondrial-like n=1 Tax=Selaginella moellendorffii TaxID=88036 RepID=UPI000D1D01DC|nr:pentatricopeptide repeat-containing protein At3g26782, mitochondrial-like [Selaginella moellendorffii]|eukprot:XP_024534155.1 pentatricopeptide repeat-containing protein At3g26782, mitochondrial-like [Selaginella moellendorffii]